MVGVALTKRCSTCEYCRRDFHSINRPKYVRSTAQSFCTYFEEERFMKHKEYRKVPLWCPYRVTKVSWETLLRKGKSKEGVRV